jgi:hypothetical protein
MQSGKLAPQLERLEICPAPEVGAREARILIAGQMIEGSKNCCSNIRKTRHLQTIDMVLCGTPNGK